MLSAAELAAIQRTAIRGRMALALTAVERALDKFDVRDRRVRQLVETLWRFVEQEDLAAFDRDYRSAPGLDVIGAVELGSPRPGSYGHLPEFLPRALTDALSIVDSYLYASVPGSGPRSCESTVRVLEGCQDRGMPLPDVSQFARLPLRESDKWGRPVPRSFFRLGPSDATRPDG